MGELYFGSVSANNKILTTAQTDQHFNFISETNDLKYVVLYDVGIHGDKDDNTIRVHYLGLNGQPPSISYIPPCPSSSGEVHEYHLAFIPYRAKLDSMADIEQEVLKAEVRFQLDGGIKFYVQN